jgi:TPR repeat protein
MNVAEGIAKLVASFRIRRAMRQWQLHKEDQAIRLGLLAAKHSDSAKIIVAQWYGGKGNWTAAIPLLQSAAANGRWEAKQVLVACHYYGNGVPVDRERAYELAADAAESGSIECQIALAQHYSDGQSREPNYFLAKKYASMAADAGRPDVLAEVKMLQSRCSNEQQSGLSDSSC